MSGSEISSENFTVLLFDNDFFGVRARSEVSEYKYIFIYLYAHIYLIYYLYLYINIYVCLCGLVTAKYLICF